MQPTSHIWFNGELLPWADASTHLITHGLHYGSAVFEGLRAYETDEGRSAIFRLHDHTKRFFYSAQVLRMKIPYSEETINQAIIAVVEKTGLKTGYLRPLAFFRGSTIGVAPSNDDVGVCVLFVPWRKYIPGDHVQVKTSQYIRIHPKSTVCDAKISGHYVNSILATNEAAIEKKQALLLDYNGNVAEGPAANVFLVKNNTLFTPAKGNILPGLTRDTIFLMANELGIPYQEKALSLQNFYEADEAFFCGTAAEITPFHQLDNKPIADAKTGKISQQLIDFYGKIVRGRVSTFSHLLTLV